MRPLRRVVMARTCKTRKYRAVVQGKTPTRAYCRRFLAHPSCAAPASRVRPAPRRSDPFGGGQLPKAEGRRETAPALDAAYAQLPADAFATLRERYGVRYAVVPQAGLLQGDVILANESYRVIAL